MHRGHIYAGKAVPESFSEPPIRISATTVRASRLASIDVSPGAIYAGKTATGTVTLEAPAPVGGIAVTLSSSNPVATVPPTVTVPAGAKSATFGVATTRLVGLSQSLTLSAQDGGKSVAATVTVRGLGVAADSPWVRFHGDTQQSGYAIGLSATSDWTSTLATPVVSSPAVGSDGKVAIGGVNGTVYCLDGRTGVVLWRYKTGGRISASPILSASGRVFVASEDGSVYALNAATGALVWKSSAGGPIASTPCLGADGRLYFGAQDNYVYALEGSSGAVAWRYKTGGAVNSSPNLDANGTLFVGSDDRRLYAFDTTSATLKWKFQTDGIVESSPALGAGSVYFGSFDGNIYGLNATTGDKLWSYPTARSIFSSPAVTPLGRVVVGSNDGNVYCLDGPTGSLRWTYPTGDMVESSPAVDAAGKVYVGNDGGNVYCLSPAGGVLNTALQSGQVVSSPVTNNGEVLAGSVAASRSFVLRNLLDSSFRALGWSVIGNRTGRAGSGALTTSQSVCTDRMEVVSPWPFTALRGVHGSWYQGANGESCFPNGLWLKDSFIASNGNAPTNASANDSGQAFTYNGTPLTYFATGSLAVTDPLAVSGAAGTRFYVHSSQSSNLSVGPPNPTVTTVDGKTAFLAGQKCFVAIAYAFPNGVESLPSGGVMATTTAAGQAFRVASPTAMTGARGYVVYCNTSSENGQSVEYFDALSGVIPFGTPAVIASGPSNLTGLRSVLMPATLGVAPTAALRTTVGATAGGTGPGAANDGEGLAFNADAAAPGSLIPAGRFSGLTRFDAMLAFDPAGIHPSVALVGDSISAETADTGFAYGFGGYLARALAGQTTNIRYDPAILPKYGRVTISTGGETAANEAGAGATRRFSLANLCTHAWINLGTNDLGTGSAAIAKSLVTLHNRYLAQGMYTWQFCILPRATSSDGFATLTGQTINGNLEGDRRALNNWIVDTTGTALVAQEPTFRVQSSITSAVDPYSGGNGSATKFTTAYPFVVGSETIKVNGVAVSTASYMYYGTATLNGVNYASGVGFVSAPARGSSVEISYQKMAGMGGYLGTKFTPCALTAISATELDRTGKVAFNGGFCRLAAAPVVTTSSTTFTTNTVTVSGATWPQNTYNGFAVFVASGPTAGQIVPILYNNASGVLTLASSWSSVPAAGTTIRILQTPRQSDGVHPSSADHLALSAALGSFLATHPLRYP